MESLVELKLTKGVTPNWENNIPEIKKQVSFACVTFELKFNRLLRVNNISS